MRSVITALALVGTSAMTPFCMYGSLRKGGHYYNLMKDCKEFGVTKTASSDFTLLEAVRNKQPAPLPSCDSLRMLDPPSTLLPPPPPPPAHSPP